MGQRMTDYRPVFSAEIELMSDDDRQAIANEMEVGMMVTVTSRAEPKRSNDDWGWGASAVRHFENDEKCTACKRRPRGEYAHVYPNGPFCTSCSVRSYAYAARKELTEAMRLLLEVDPAERPPTADWLKRSMAFIDRNRNRV
jgi:hypothetical protein